MKKITQRRPLVKGAYQKNNSISQPKHMLWVLKRSVSMRRFFCAPKTYAKIMGKKYYKYYAENFVYLNLWLRVALSFKALT